MKIKDILMVGILLAIITVGAVSAADDGARDDSALTSGQSDDPIVKSSDADELYMNSQDENDGETYGADSTSASNDTENGEYYLFRGDCWTVNNNFESSAAVTSTNHSDLTVTGTFRTQGDLVGLYWNSKDPIEHPYISYGVRNDYSGVIFEFDYEITGAKDLANSTLTIAANTGETYYLAMNQFVKNNHVILDFNNLTLLPGDSYFDRNGQGVNVNETIKMNVTDLKYIMIGLVPQNKTDNYTIMENVNFTFNMTNINVTNGKICEEQHALPQHQYRLSEGYDDSYNINPYRLAKEMRKLGYAGWVDLYIGASYYYEKNGTVGDVISDLNLNHNRTEKMVLDSSVAINNAFRAWLDCYSRELRKNNVQNLVISVSMENLQCPQSWRQMDMNGNFAMSGWEPSTFLYSPCNDEAVSYMQMVSEACLDIALNNGLRPNLQMGETWWWWTSQPYFYDNATKAKYHAEFGTNLPQYSSVWTTDYNQTTIDWLNQQLVKYSDALSKVPKQRYSNVNYMALFYLPSVIDTDTVPPMIRGVNYIKDAYSPDKLDILQIEDYDWVIFGNSHHSDAYTIGQELGFSEDRIQYFGGFVEYKDHAERLWPLIEDAMEEANQKKFNEVYVWAGTQVRRDSKIIGYDEYVILNNLKSGNTPGTVSPVITAPEFVSTDLNFTVKIQTDEWVNGDFIVYEYVNYQKGKLLASNSITNGTSSVVLSSSDVGLNRFYLEFNYLNGGYHLIWDVYIIENAADITADVTPEVEIGSDAIVTFSKPISTRGYLYVTVDENASNSYYADDIEFTTAISNLSAGYHTVTLAYNDGHYIDGKLVGEVYYNTFKVKVGIKTVIETADVNTTYNSSDNLVVTLKDGKGNELNGKEISIALNGTVYNMTTDGKGQVRLLIDLLPANYTANISYAGDDDYLSSLESVNILVNKIVTDLTANDIAVIYGDEANLTITLKDINGRALTGKEVSLALNGTNSTLKTDANGQAVLPIGLLPGNYTAEISYAENEIYLPSSATSNIVIEKIVTSLSADDISFIYDEPLNLTVTLKDRKNDTLAGKEVLITLNGVNHTISTDANGQAILPVDLLPGNYTAQISYAGDNVYVASSDDAKVDIYKVATNLTTSDVSYIYDEPVDLIATLMDRKGNALVGNETTILLNGKKYTLNTDDNGQVTLPIDLLPGNYTAEISYAENDVYLASSARANIAIEKIATNLTTTDVSYIYDEPVDLIATLLDRKGNALIGNETTIILNGVKHTLKTDEKGQVTLPIDLLPGNYTAEISYAENDVYLASSAVSKIAIYKVATNLTTSDVSFIYDEPVDLIATLKDRKGNALVGNETTIILNGVKHTLKTDEKGQITLPIDLLPGNYTAEISFAGDEIYIASSASAGIVIEKIATTLTAKDLNFIYDEPTSLIATLKDRKGNALVGNETTIILNGEKHTLKTDEKGQVTLPIDLLPGNYTAEISYAENSIYLPSSASAGIVINKIETTVTANNIGFIYGNDAELIVSLKDRKNSALADKVIQVLLNGTTYNLTTDGNGRAKLPIDLLPGMYIARASYAGNEIYLSSSALANININKITTILTSSDITFVYDDPLKLVVTLKDMKRNALEGKVILMNLNGKNLTETTDANGQAKFAIDSLPGKYVAELSFAEDLIYLSSSASANVAIDKVATSLSADDISFTYGDDASLVAVLKDRKGNALTGKAISMTLNGSNSTATTDKNGEARFTIGVLPQSYVAEVSFAGDDVYVQSSSSAKVNVDKISTNLNATCSSVVYGEVSNLIVTLKDERGNLLIGENVTIKLNNKVYNKTIDVNGQVKVSVKLSANQYPAEITFAGDEIYKSSATTSKVVIKKDNTKLTASSKSFNAKAKTKKVTATLKSKTKNAAIKNVYVKLTVNKKTYKVKTNSKGVATFSLKLTKKGKYNAVYKFDGNSNYKSSTKKVKITIK